MAGEVESFLKDPYTTPNPHLATIDTDNHGFTVVQLDGDQLEATQYAIDASHAKTNLGEELDDKFTTRSYRVYQGSPDLFHEIDGIWLRWNPETVDWS